MCFISNHLCPLLGFSDYWSILFEMEKQSCTNHPAPVHTKDLATSELRFLLPIPFVGMALVSLVHESNENAPTRHFCLDNSLEIHKNVMFCWKINK